jgi:hypothetical protein
LRGAKEEDEKRGSENVGKCMRLGLSRAATPLGRDLIPTDTNLTLPNWLVPHCASYRAIVMLMLDIQPSSRVYTISLTAERSQ